MKSKHQLVATRRERTGSRYAARERAAGKLPAVVYGHKEEPVAVSVDAKTALRYFHDGERVFEVNIEGGSAETVLLKDLQYDYLGTNIIHADFERVSMDEVIETTVPVHLVGEAKGEKRAGAVLVHPNDSVSIRCALKDIPDQVDVDITELDAGDVIFAKDLTLPAGAELRDAPELRIVAVVWAKGGDEDTAEGEGIEAEAAPEAIRQKSETEPDADKAEDN